MNTNYNCDCRSFSKEEKEEYFTVPVDDISESIQTGDVPKKEAVLSTFAAMETWVVTY